MSVKIRGSLGNSKNNLRINKQQTDLLQKNDLHLRYYRAPS
jgi:hypothetical protein